MKLCVWLSFSISMLMNKNIYFVQKISILFDDPLSPPLPDSSLRAGGDEMGFDPNRKNLELDVIRMHETLCVA